MADYGSQVTDRAISKADRELRKTYQQAQKEMKKKLADFKKRFAEQDKEKRKQLAEGEITEQEYRDWLAGRVFVQRQWESKVEQINQVMLDHNRQAMKLVSEKRFDVFAENYNIAAFESEKKIAVSFNVYSAEAVARLILGDPDLLPEWNIDEEKDYDWNYKKVNNIIRQGIIQGESVDQITDRLCTELSSQNESKMRMFARTAMNSAQSAGRQKQMEDAASMGIEVKKRWIATLDNRTRDAHRHLDMQTVPYDQAFNSDLGSIMFPGDPGAKPANVFNCRCTMRTLYPKYEDENATDWRENETIDGQSYQEWKEGKKKKGLEVKPAAVTPAPKEPEPKLAGIEKGNPMTHEEADTGRVNPHYGTGRGYNINCQSCVVAYEARRRGYDIEVVPNDKQHPMCEKLSRNTRLAWKDRKTGERPEFMFPSRPTLASRWEGEPPTPKRFKALLDERLIEGARYHIGFGWKGSKRSGHIVTIGKQDGELFIYDPQCDRRYTGKQVEQYFTRMKMQRTSYGYKYYQYPEVLRVDDKDIDFEVADQVVKGAKP